MLQNIVFGHDVTNGCCKREAAIDTYTGLTQDGVYGHYEWRGSSWMPIPL